MESSTGRSRGWPFIVVAAISEGVGLSVRFETLYLFCRAVPAKLRRLNGREIFKEAAIRARLQRDCIHVGLIQLRSKSPPNSREQAAVNGGFASLAVTLSFRQFGRESLASRVRLNRNGIHYLPHRPRAKCQNLA